MDPVEPKLGAMADDLERRVSTEKTENLVLAFKLKTLKKLSNIRKYYDTKEYQRSHKAATRLWNRCAFP